MAIRWLTKSDVRKILSMDEAIELMSIAFCGLTDGSVVVPQRTNISNDLGTLLYKPAMMGSHGLFAMKAVSVFPGNAQQGLPVTTGLLLLNDASTGLPLAIMDAEYLTALRTGAAAGLATRLMASPHTSTAALFGIGGQAPCQLAALATVLPLKKIYVFSRHVERTTQFCARHQPEYAGIDLIPSESLGVLKKCGVISTVTTSCKPLFRLAEIATGIHINAMGSFRPEMIEIDPAVVAKATVVVDQREAALREAGEFVMSRKSGVLPADFFPQELGELLLNDSFEAHRDEVTLFKSVGNAAQDIVCAGEILRKAAKMGLGTLLGDE